MSASEIAKKINPILKASGVTRAGLFGSAARGQMRSTSDVDILIEIDKDISLLDFIGIKQQLEQKLRRTVDLVEYKAIKYQLKKRILKEQIPLL